MARTKFSQLRDAVVAKPGAVERLAGLRVETLEEIRLYELRHGEAISQAELACSCREVVGVGFPAILADLPRVD